MNISADRLDQQIFPSDGNELDRFRDGATSYITRSGYNSRMARDLTLDAKNPRQEMTKDQDSLDAINAIPDFVPDEVDISHPADFEASNAVKLYQQSRVNSTAQETMFTDPKALETKGLNTDGRGKELQGIPQSQLYSFSGGAAAKTSNFLEDEDGAHLNSVESMSAF